MKIIKGKILQFTDNPFKKSIKDSVKIIENGALLVNKKIIKEVDYYKNLKSKFPDLKVYDYGSSLIIAGFVDCHMHYPQTNIIASYGKRLLDWLNKYTFPEESKFTDYEYAKKIASFTLDQCLRNGITTVSSYCTTSVVSVDAFFNEAIKKDMCVVAGRTCMNRNAPEELLDDTKKSYDESELLIKKWHLKERLNYAITPRFALTSSSSQLESLGDLWKKYPDCLMQTHLSEQLEEIKLINELFPKSLDYLDVYEKFGLLQSKSIFGHCIHLKNREYEALGISKASVAHCPTSNLFIGSGIFNLKRVLKNNINVGLATDTAGGTSFSMLKTMSAAYNIGQLSGLAIHPAQLLWLATVGSSKSLHLDKKIGNIEAGKYADLAIIDLSSSVLIDTRRKKAENFWEELFPTLIMGDDRAIISTWISGKEFK